MEAVLIVQLSLKETSVSCTQTITATPWQVTLNTATMTQEDLQLLVMFKTIHKAVAAHEMLYKTNDD